MSFIKDTFFGGAEKKAAQVATQGFEKGIAATQAAARRAEEFAFPLFGAAQQNLQQGFQGALDVFGQSLPAQTDVLQQGNLGAQQQLLAGLPQFQNAIFGNQVDFSALQPTQIQTPDLGFFQQQLPQFVDPFAPQEQGANQPPPSQGFSGAINADPFGLGLGLSGGSGGRRRINDKRIRN